MMFLGCMVVSSSYRVPGFVGPLAVGVERIRELRRRGVLCRGISRQLTVRASSAGRLPTHGLVGAVRSCPDRPIEVSAELSFVLGDFPDGLAHAALHADARSFCRRADS